MCRYSDVGTPHPCPLPQGERGRKNSAMRRLVRIKRFHMPSLANISRRTRSVSLASSSSAFNSSTISAIGRYSSPSPVGMLLLGETVESFFRIFEYDDDGRRGGVVEQVFRQVEHAFDEVLLHEPAAHVLFLVGVGVAAAARRGAG